jgi:AcrR family transcriptional regulator
VATRTGAPFAAPSGLRADSARVRERILRCARADLTAGATTLSMNALAADAGVGVGTVYRHFPSAEVLLESLAIDAYRTLVAHAHAAAGDPDPAAAFERLLGEAHALQLAEPALAQVLSAETLACADVVTLGAEFFQSISVVLRRAREAGALRDDVTPDDLRRLMHGLYAATRAGRPDAAGRYLDILLRGLRAPV